MTTKNELWQALQTEEKRPYPQILDYEQQLWQQVAQGNHGWDAAQLEAIRLRFTGRKSPLQELLKSLKDFPAQERKEAGARINKLKVELEQGVAAFMQEQSKRLLDEKLQKETLDISLPLPPSTLGARHPFQIVMEDLQEPFRRMGFSVVDGPEIDTEFFNFEALNVAAEHPAREMQDTFFLSSEWVLRTHTSNVQAHAMIERGVPLRIVCPGCVYRHEHDMTHVPSFRQMECLVVDRGLHMGHLRYIINELLSAAFGHSVKIRFRASYFPFTEPSAEVDVECQQCLGNGCRSCKFTGWSEIGGCGVVHTSVLKACGVDPQEFQGIAFGFGVDRIAKDRFGVSDLRDFFEGQLSFLKTFRL